MYDTVVALGKLHQNEITHETAHLIKQAQITWYSELSIEELVKGNRLPLKLALHYLENGDLNDWKHYCAEITLKHSKQGVGYASIIKVGDCIIQAMLKCFQKELPLLPNLNPQDLPTERLLKNVERRLQGLKMVGSAVISRTNLSQKTEN